MPSPWPCINLIRPGPPASSQKRVFCITPWFSVGTTGGSRPCPSARLWLQGRECALRHVSCWLAPAFQALLCSTSHPGTGRSASDRAGVRSWHGHYCPVGSRPRHGYAALDALLCDTPGRFVIQTAFWGSWSPGDSPGPSGLVGVPYIPGWVFWMAGDGSVWGQSGGSTAVRGPGRRSERFSGCGACGWPGRGL